MTDPTMADRIATASVVDLGFAYLAHAGAPWLGWPLPSDDLSDADWLGHVVRTVARTPVCQRTEAEAWTDLGRIDNMGLRRLLAKRKDATP